MARARATADPSPISRHVTNPCIELPKVSMARGTVIPVPSLPVANAERPVRPLPMPRVTAARR